MVMYPLKFLLKKFSSYLVALSSSLLVFTVQAQEASLTEGMIIMPVVVVGDIVYYVELSQVAGTDPAEFTLRDARQIFNANIEGATSLNGSILSIPSISVAGVSYWYDLQLVGNDPITLKLSGSGLAPKVQTGKALALFGSSVSQNIVQARCILCHVEGGIASNSKLQFQRSSSSSLSNNFAVFESFLSREGFDAAYVLSKVSGGDAHGGGVQLPAGGTDYTVLNNFLSALTGVPSNSGVDASSVDFFSGVEMQANTSVLRRASIILAGRLPSAAEIQQVSVGGVQALREVLKNLMQGEEFHQFLVEGANDKLLVRSLVDSDLLSCPDTASCFPKHNNYLVQLSLETLAKGYEYGFELDAYYKRTKQGVLESPLELIAHVVENDLPYSEILTADYMMFNPSSNFSAEGTAVFVDPDDLAEFNPGIITGYHQPGPTTISELVPNVIQPRITERGELQTNIPHAGVLNSIPFLFRYPTTATNRNRARARWTLLHFLDIDIERSAPRTIDSVALADKNNPTLLNINCTVCHSTMDPVAGAFQNFDEEGFYRSGYGGQDSLDRFYKQPENGNTSLYQHGDIWYRDMRAPGFLNTLAPSTDNSLQWLAQQIVKEPGFGKATVKFWWPSLIGTEVLRFPDVESDADYASQLAAYDAQNATITALAEQFMNSGMSLKDLLTEMVVTPWFRADYIDQAESSSTMLDAHSLANLGSRKLLTPERLQQKTTAITGFTWHKYYNFNLKRYDTGLGDIYRLYYGGINSGSIIKRSTEMSPLMSSVAMAHALESSCPIVLRDLIRPDSERRLFTGIDFSETPASHSGEIREKMVELHEKFLGKRFAASSAEITSAYNLFVESWTERSAAGNEGALFWGAERCDFLFDNSFFEGTDIADTFQTLIPLERGFQRYELNGDIIGSFLGPYRADSNHTKQAWTTVIAYLMTHYYYLYD